MVILAQKQSLKVRHTMSNWSVIRYGPFQTTRQHLPHSCCCQDNSQNIFQFSACVKTCLFWKQCQSILVVVAKRSSSLPVLIGPYLIEYKGVVKIFTSRATHENRSYLTFHNCLSPHLVFRKYFYSKIIT